MGGKAIDLTGQRFGRLVVIRRVEDYVSPNGNKLTRYHCLCDCGVEKDIVGSSLTRKYGAVQSCGCLQREKFNYKTHGQSKSRLYRIWCAMKNRCNNPKDKCYSIYGGRGITVCDEWLHDFVAFQNWALSNGYSDDLSIDRIDNDKGYRPDNCRWATTSEQANNHRNNHTITINGKKQTLSAWCKEARIPRERVKQRLKRGWTLEEALEFTPRTEP